MSKVDSELINIVSKLSSNWRLRRVLREVGIGRLYSRFRQLQKHSVRSALNLYIMRRRYLRRILDATPVPVGTGDIEVHMLLNHQRIYEGMWTLYSFIHFAQKECHIIVHDDGTLTPLDIEKLNKLFPGCKVISRSTADVIVLGYFKQHGLQRCLRLRQSLIFTLKLFDPFFFQNSRHFILLDSDVLFFAPPHEVVADFESSDQNMQLVDLYSLDNGYRYSLEPQELRVLLGKKCIERFNPGLLRASHNTVDFQRIEGFLQHPGFWTPDGGGDYYAELTLWAMEMTLSGAVPLPSTYAICSPNVGDSDVIFGHYCGGGYWADLYYTRGLPFLASHLL